METFKVSEYRPEFHEKFHAIGLPEELAEKLTTVDCVIDGMPQAQCSVLIWKTNTPYRGDLLICAVSHDYKVPGHICGLVELYDVKPCRGITPVQWHDAAKPAGVDTSLGYAWFFRNPRRVIEMPCNVPRKPFSLIVHKGEVTEYPMNVVIGEDEWRKIRAKYGLR